jgi:hypothetical protein
MTALRVSAVLSILVAALYVRGLIVAIQYGGLNESTIWLMLVGVAAPLIPGVLALFGRATVLLPVAWGWLLGVHLPKLLVIRPQITPEMMQMMRKDGGNLFMVGPDYYGMALVGIALVGLGLYFYAYYKQGVR